jgi:hypothetical protein
MKEHRRQEYAEILKEKATGRLYMKTPKTVSGQSPTGGQKQVGDSQRWADRYFGPLIRCPADYRNVSGPADWKK